MSEPYVFISYSRKDQAFLTLLADSLRTAGVRVWLDTDQISPGANWERSIAEALRGASALLYVASANSARSQWMAREVSAVLGHETPVIPLILDDEGERGLPASLRAIQWVDFRAGYDPAIQQLIVGLQAFRSTTPMPVAERKSKGYVFLSYAEEDSDFVDELKVFLAERRYAYWDYRESDRDYHQDLYLELEGVIREAAGTLSILSPDWKRSRTAIKEYHFSTDVGTPVFLLRFRDPGPTLVVSGLPYIDFTTERDRAYQRLAKELTRKGL